LTSQLHVNQPFTQPIERLGDFHIMDYAIQSGRFDEETLRIINHCRLYLHVTTVSELCNADGTSMLPEMFACRRAPWMDPTMIVTLQKKPNDYQIRYWWKRLCHKWCKEDGFVAEDIKLREWLQPSQKLRLRQSTYTESEPTPILYHWKDNCYWEYLPGQPLSANAIQTQMAPTPKKP
jgi:hypothetical protein